MGVETQIFQKFFRKFFKVFQSPKKVWNGFCPTQEPSKVIFCWLYFFSHMQYGGRKIQKLIFRSPKMVRNGFCAMKEHWKVIFVDFNFVQPGRTGKTQFLKWSEISQRAVRSSFYWQYFCKCAVWCGKHFFIFHIRLLLLCFYLKKYVCLHACVQNCNFYVWKNNWKKWKNKNFMYKIMRIHVYKESVDLFISKYNCASVE